MNVRCMWLLLGLCCSPAALWSQGDEERQAERWIVHVAGDPLRLGPLRTAIRESRPPDGVTDIITACQARVDRDRQALLDDVKALGGRVVANWWLIDAVAVDMPPGSLEALRSLRGVTRVERDGRAQPLIKVSTWAENCDSISAHAVGIKGQGACVAIVDTGANASYQATQRPHVIYYPEGDRTKPHRLVLNRQIGLLPAEDTVGHGTIVTACAAGGKWPDLGGGNGHAPLASIASYSIKDNVGGGASYATVVSAWQAVATDRLRYGIVVANNSYAGEADPTSATQQALDACAYNADVLICVAAGNGRGTGNSQSAANGLAVNGISGWTYLAGFGALGPLTGDPQRFFPDIAAMWQVAAPLANNETISLGQGGTSVASPQVAGIATLLRSYVTTLSAIETKALLLAGARSIEAFNPYAPSNTRNRYGVGLVNARRSLDIVRSGSYGRATVSSVSRTWTRSIPVVPGRRYRAAIAWMRWNMPSRVWSNLDLEVLDTANRRIAIADAPRNLYEFAAFKAEAATQVLIRVTATSLDAASQDFAWAVGEAEGPYVPPRAAEFGVACQGSGARLDSGFVLPTGLDPWFGGAQQSTPFGVKDARYQQVFVPSASQQKETLIGMALRPDDWDGSPLLFSQAEISLGYGASGPQLSSTFAQNWSGQPTQVFSGPVIFPARADENKRTDLFRPSILFSQPWIYDPALGSLLVEVRCTTGQAQWHLLDAVTGRSDTASLFAHPATAVSGYLTPGTGLVVKFLRAATGGARPALYSASIPLAGWEQTSVINHARRSGAAVILGGFSKDRWGAIQLPLDLSGLGAPGCSLLTSVDGATGVGLDVSGNGSIRFPLPADVLLVGRTFYQQGTILEPTVNALALVTTNALEVVIGGHR